MRFLLISITILFLSACATKRIDQLPTEQSGHWSARAQVENLKTRERNRIDLEMFVNRPGDIRLEATAAFGIQVASLLVKQDRITILAHRQKRYYEGAVNDSSLQNVLGISFNPKILIPVLFDENLSSAKWKCELLENGLPEKCVHPQGSMTVQWSERQGALKKIRISSADFVIDMLITDFTTKVELDRVFNISIPKSYTGYKLN